jgi:hypothetical protein
MSISSQENTVLFVCDLHEMQHQQKNTTMHAVTKERCSLKLKHKIV